jgi:uncharacterized protein (DUF488 family)
MGKKLHTIGYEGAALDGFLSALSRARVSLVIDVRAIAVSRRKGFSKTALAAALAENGIDYLHLRDLGDPKPGREAAREGRLADFRRIYRAHLSGAAARIALNEAAKAATQQAACLLCYEAEPNGCHRSIVANELARSTKFAVHHLHPDPAGAAGAA